MKTIIVLILAALLTTGCVLPPAPDVQRTQYRIYDTHNRYKGRVDASGRIFNEHGRYDGRIDYHGRIYDDHGRVYNLETYFLSDRYYNKVFGVRLNTLFRIMGKWNIYIPF
jgi:hypothetical protein